MLTTLGVNNRLLLYGSVITKILRHFRVPLSEPVYVVTKQLGEEIISRIRFHRKNMEWVKATSSKNKDTLVAS